MTIADDPGASVAVGVGVAVGTSVGTAVAVGTAVEVARRTRVGSGVVGSAARTFGATATAVGTIVAVGVSATTAFFGTAFVGATAITRWVGVTGGVNGWTQLTTARVIVRPSTPATRRTPTTAPRTEVILLKESRIEEPNFKTFPIESSPWGRPIVRGIVGFVKPMQTKATDRASLDEPRTMSIPGVPASCPALLYSGIIRAGQRSSPTGGY